MDDGFDLLYIATQGVDLPTEVKRKMTEMNGELVNNVNEWRIVLEAFTDLLRLLLGNNSWLVSMHEAYVRHLRSKEVAWLQNEGRDHETARKAQVSHHRMLHRFLASCAQGQQAVDFQSIKFADTCKKVEENEFGYLVTLPTLTRKRKDGDRDQKPGDLGGDRQRKREVTNRYADSRMML